MNIALGLNTQTTLMKNIYKMSQCIGFCGKHIKKYINIKKQYYARPNMNMKLIIWHFTKKSIQYNNIYRYVPVHI